MSYLRYLCLFGSSLPPVVCRRDHVLYTLFVFTYAWCPTHSVLWFVFRRLVFPMLAVSLDCPFLIAPSIICNICLMETGHKDNYSHEIIRHMTFLRCTRVTNDLGFYS